MAFIEFSDLPAAQKQNWLLHAVAPRPIALASTIDENGNANLSPFSFFNAFSSNPPIIIFSTAKRVRNNTYKHTHDNILQTKEVVVNICDYDIVQQMSLSSCEFSAGVDEFIKAGFTKENARRVKPFLVKEAKIKMECKVLELKSLGDEGGAGQLVIAEVLCMHVNDEILNVEKTMIDQLKMHHIARLGGDWYSVVNDQSLFKVSKPNIKLAIGFDALPQHILNSKILTANNLGQLANVHELPEINVQFEDDMLKNIFQYYSINPDEMETEIHLYAKKLLDENKIDEAWQVLLTIE